MARSAGVPLVPEDAEAALHEPDRWPVLYSALFVLTSSILLWALIIAGIGWLIG